MPQHILVVDDETAIADLVEVYLTGEGFTVHKCHTAADALACIRSTALDLAILDVMLPDMDGFALCRRIRETHLFPILMLTAKVEDLDKITGLTLGADDYITKPFNPLELVARVKTQLRRYTRYNQGQPPLFIGGAGRPGSSNLQKHPQMHAVRRGAVSHPAGVLHPLVPLRKAGPGGVQRGAVRGCLGRAVHGQQQHRHESHCPAAGEATRAPPESEVY